MDNRKHLATATLSMIIAISLGAMGAHYLKETLELPTDKLESWKTGVFYQIIHALGIFSVILISKVYEIPNTKWVINLFILGTICFSGSIYFLTLNHIWQIDALRFLGPITPIGGILFISGWVVLLLKLRNIKE